MIIGLIRTQRRGGHVLHDIAVEREDGRERLILRVGAAAFILYPEEALDLAELLVAGVEPAKRAAKRGKTDPASG